jgi:hypothetical protein
MVSAGAQGYGAFNQDTIYGTLQHDEHDSFDKAVTQVLNDPQDNKTMNWHSDSKRANAPTASIYASAAGGQNGMPCRDLHASLQRGTAAESWKFLFCRVKGGQWKVASQSRQ